MLFGGQVYVVEHKTTGLDITPGSSYWRRLRLDTQPTNYIVGSRSLGFEPAGVLYDVLAKPRITPYRATPIESRKYTQPSSKACPECKKKGQAYPAPHVFGERLETTDDGEVKTTTVLIAADDGESTRLYECQDGRIVTDPGGKLYANLREFDETLDEFRLRLRADIGEHPDEYYQRSMVVRLADEEVEAAHDTWSTARSLRESELAERWPRNADACDQYGSLCEYFDVCAGAGSIADPMRFRDAGEHEELAPETTAKRKLPLVTTSSLKSFRSCPKKYYYRYVLRRRPRESTAALRFGTLMHVGLEWWWKTADLATAMAALRGHGAADPLDLVKAEEMLLGYHVRWIDEPLEVLAVEKEFVAPLVNPATGAESRTYERGGKIDALVRVAA